jgi:16S rRNA (uracil1498-N3)-methyltransferase
VLSLRAGSQPIAGVAGAREITLLSGPEGGLAPAEEDAAAARGWAPVQLGPRVLRAETAPLAALALLTLARAGA